MSRRREAGLASTGKCALCQHQHDDEFHQMWECPGLEQTPQLTTTDYLKTRARNVGRQQPAIWVRGLMPTTWLQLPETPTTLTLYTFGDLVDHQDPWILGAYWWFSDGSGGEQGNNDLLRRCGWSLVGFEPHTTEPKGGQYGNLPDDPQTVPRAELFPLLRLAQLTKGTTHLWTDSSYVCNYYTSTKTKNQYGANADLWHQLWRLLHARPGKIHVHKVKAHEPETKVLNGTMDLYTWLGNTMADAYADLAASLHQHTPEDIANAKLAQQTMWHIQRRALTAHAQHIEATPPLTTFGGRKRTPRAQQQTRQPSALKRALDTTLHTIVDNDGGYKCTTCLQRATKRRAVTWLTGLCIPPQQQPSHIPRQAGGGQSHPSHNTQLTKGRQHTILWCTKCGRWVSMTGKSCLRDLAKECSNHQTRAAQTALNKLRQGKHPKTGQRL